MRSLFRVCAYSSALFFFATAATAASPDLLRPPAKPDPDRQHAPPTDPPGLLGDDRIQPLADLASRLSADRGWLGKETLAAFDQQSLRLDELFADAPALLEVDGVPYRILLERVGAAWQGFDPLRDRYVVFLSHEVYDALGPDAALAFEDGDEMVIFDFDFAILPAVALTLVDVPPFEMAKVRSVALELGPTIGLGTPRLRVARGDPLASFAVPAPPFGVAAKAVCEPRVAPTSCVNGKPRCGESNYAPYFFVKKLKIKTDHEGAFRGKPEIDLFPMRLDLPSGPGGTTNARTNWIFSGRTVTDLAGFSVYLPDINNTNQWYSMTNGLAVFPVDTGNEWGVTLIEDDSEAGKLKKDANLSVLFKVASTTGSIINVVTNFSTLNLISAVGALIDLLGNLPNDDDLYKDSLGFRNSLFCTNGVGQPFPKEFSFNANEWEMTGFFGCADSSCTPPPPTCVPLGVVCSNTTLPCCAGSCTPIGFGGLSICS